MPAKFHDQERAAVLDRLVNEWLPAGPPVAILEGFPGCGKTQLAREVALKTEQSIDLIEPQEGAADPVEDLFLELALALEARDLPRLAQEFDKGAQANFTRALLDTLRHERVLIVVDEFQRLLPKTTTTPPALWRTVVEQLNNSLQASGRLLLVSNRAIKKSERWCENCRFEEVRGLADEEAEELFSDLLKASGAEAGVPVERRREIAHRLGGNPRALKTLVSGLRTDSLDDLLSAAPDLMKPGDVVLGPRLLEDFERELIERALPKLDADLQKFLRRMAVHRRPFRKEALASFPAGRESSETLRQQLIDRFLLDQNLGWYFPHPLAREISVTRLRAERGEWVQAHTLAANYHMRHFEARQMPVASTLAASYAELRHHLFEAGRIERLHEASDRLTQYVLSQISLVTPVPSTQEALEERIALLSTVPENRRPRVLEYHLARCFKRRNAPGDDNRALKHVRAATGPHMPSHVWLIRLDLEYALHGIDMALPVLAEALKYVSADENASTLYVRGAELLGRAGRTVEAIELLQAGIKVIPPDKDLFSLYQSCAELLARGGRSAEAIELLQAGIKVIPADKSLFSLYQSCSDLLRRGDRSAEAIELLHEGIELVPADKGLSTLYLRLTENYCRIGKHSEAMHCLREGLTVIPSQFNRYRLAQSALLLCVATGDGRQLHELLAATGVSALERPQIALGEVLKLQNRGDWAGAAECAATARNEFPQYLVLAAQEAFSRLAYGDAEAAYRAMMDFPNMTFTKGGSPGWLAALIDLRRGANDEAEQALSSYLGRPVERERELNEAFLLQLWDQQEKDVETYRLCFHFPILPPSLTGLPYVTRRVPFSPSVFSVSRSTQANPPLPPAEGRGIKESRDQPLEPDAYVSYAWGEDTTLDGRRREEIVDRLCEAIRSSGRTIGRDKERMSAGDSIERFAQEISKSQRIIAVISAKSLRSTYCMAHELFRSYRRCDYQRAEFQEKVIALVMDDAKELLKDDLAVVALAKDWTEKYEALRDKLKEVDPNRKSSARWVFVDLMGDMCPRLPDMLDAIKDIVMKRGFDEIVADEFQEVLNRLPAPQNSAH